jgi:capsular polysaccharide export protein
MMGLSFKFLYRKFGEFASDLLHMLGGIFPHRRSDVRRQLEDIFSRRHRIFFRKKKLKPAPFPYHVHDPYLIFGDAAKFGDFSLVGDNWVNGTDKPVALLWGFNNWKWGFTVDYLQEYRVAFAPRKIGTFESILSIRRFPVKANCLVFWGYTETKGLRRYANRRKIQVLRMEDGFLRSSSLGASHATPYSLVFDKSGLHYDPARPSDLENILRFHSFTNTELADAEFSMGVMRSLGLSKYNPPVLQKQPIKVVNLRRRVAVIGQVDNDMAMRLGNPNRWTMMQLIRLAKFEHPDADIVYRPHPDIYQGYQRSRFRSRHVRMICEIESPDVPMAEFLEDVDHVYTVTSLAGLEALIQGKVVTVVGAAFYAGWGLTDDRLEFQRRNVRRSLTELFSAAYLLYPRYLGSMDNSKVGFHAACLRITADTKAAEFDLARRLVLDRPEAKLLLASTKYWPNLMFRMSQEEFESVAHKIEWSTFLSNRPGRIFQSFFLHTVAGRLRTEGALDSFLTRVRRFIDVDIYAAFLITLGQHAPGNYAAKHLAWVLAETNEEDIAHQVLLNRLKKQSELESSISPALDAELDERDSSTQTESNFSVSDAQRNLMVELFEYHVRRKTFGEALKIGQRLLISGHGNVSISLKIAKLAEATFDTQSARDISHFCQHADLFAENRRALSIYLNNLPYEAGAYEELRLHQELALEIRLNPERINNAFALSRSFASDRTHLDAVVVSWLGMDNEQSVQKAMAFLEVGRPLHALNVMKGVLASEEESDRVSIAYAKVLIALGEYHAAMVILNKSRRYRPSEGSYKESLRLLAFLGRFAEAEEIVEDASIKRIDIGEAFIMPTLLGVGKIENGYKCYLNVPFRSQLLHYFPEKYYVDESLDEFRADTLIMAVYGPGDEIRFASLYEEFAEKFGFSNFSITCDYRFETLLQRSFPKIKFVPVRRTRGFSNNYPRSNYDQLPGAELCVMLDNSCVEVIEQSRKIVMVTDLIWQFRKTYASFPRKSFLRHDHQLADSFRKKLKNGVFHVGICWRSSLTTYSRNVNYLAVEELTPLFGVENIQFVNLQYDECEEELNWIHKNFPGRMLNFDEIDQFNDFESVAALMKCMDLVIAPATSVAELAAALGCPTLLFCNSAEIEWRKADDFGRDVWQESMMIVNGDVKDEKCDLVAEIKKKLVTLAHEPAEV